MISPKDESLLKLLEKNSRLTVQELSKKTGIPPTTVHNRIKKLEQSGIIQGYVTKVNKQIMGKNSLKGFILITVDYGILKTENKSQRELARELCEIAEVEEASIVTGESDIILRIHSQDMNSLNEMVIEKIRNVSGVEKTKIVVILESFSS